MHRRRPSGEFSRFELEQKRGEYKHKKVLPVLTRSKIGLSSKGVTGMAKGIAPIRSVMNAGIQGEMAIG